MVRNLKKKRCDRCRAEYQPTNGKQKLCFACSPWVGNPKPKQGVGGLKTKHRPAEAARIENLGKMNDRHRALLEARDKDGLLELADEYLQLNYPCTVMAKAIKLQAENLHHE